VPAAMQELIWNMVERSEANLNPTQQSQFYKLLLGFHDVFAQSSTDFG